MHFALARAAKRCFTSGRVALLGLLCLAVTACGGGGELATNAAGVMASDAGSGSASPQTGSGVSDPGSASPPAGSAASDPGSTEPTSPPPGSGNSPSNPPSPPSFTFGDLTKTFGDGSFQLDPPVSGQNGPFAYASSTPGVAQISGNTVTIVGAGVTTLTATEAATGRSATATLTVKKAQPALQLPALSFPIGMTFPLAAQTKSDGLVTYALSNLVVAPGPGHSDYDATYTYDQNGQTFLYSGAFPATATITVSQAPTANYEGATISTPLTVEKGRTDITIYPSRVDMVSLSSINATGSAQQSVLLVVTQDYDYAGTSRPMSVSIDHPEIADVGLLDDSGSTSLVVQPKTPGVAKMTVSVPATANFAAATKTYDLTVNQQVILQQAPTLTYVGHWSAAAGGYYPSLAGTYTYDPNANPPIVLKACTNVSKPVLFSFTGFPNVYADPYQDAQQVIVTLTDDSGEHQLNPYFNWTTFTYDYGYDLLTWSQAMTLKVKVLSRGSATYFPSVESSYAIQLMARYGTPDCATAGSQ